MADDLAPPAAAPTWTPSIQTARLFLRPLSTYDLPAIHAIYAADLVRATSPSMPLADPHTRARTLAWLHKRTAPPAFNFAVLRVDPARPREAWPLIGLVGCPLPGPEIGFVFDVAHHGRGYATEALRGFLALYWAREPDAAGAERAAYAEASAAAENTGSRRVMEKCGFEEVPGGASEEEDWNRPGERFTVVTYRLTRPT